MLPPGPGLNFDYKCVFKGLFGLFADSLPDAWGAILLRHVLEREGLPPTLSQLDHLGLVGCEGWGALEYEAMCGHKDARDASGSASEGGNESCLPRLKALACRVPEYGSASGCVLPDLDRLADEAMRIMGKDGYFGDCLEELFGLSGFLGGARLKVSLVLEDGEPYNVKFRAPQDPENMGLLEHEASRAARLAGIDMPETRLLASAKGPGHFAVRRFDRYQGLKIHCHTACGLLHSTSLFEMDYSFCLALVSDLTRHRKDVEEMIRRMVFNVRLGNHDQHSKNVAIMLGRENRWRLAPATISCHAGDARRAPGHGEREGRGHVRWRPREDRTGPGHRRTRDKTHHRAGGGCAARLRLRAAVMSLFAGRRSRHRGRGGPGPAPGSPEICLVSRRP